MSVLLFLTFWFSVTFVTLSYENPKINIDCYILLFMFYQYLIIPWHYRYLCCDWTPRLLRHIYSFPDNGTNSSQTMWKNELQNKNLNDISKLFTSFMLNFHTLNITYNKYMTISICMRLKHRYGGYVEPQSGLYGICKLFFILLSFI